MSIVCKVVETKKDLKAFIDFPHDLYKDDKNYVPEIYIGQRSMFDKKNYPYYKHGDACLFLVYRDKTIVGRIAACLLYTSDAADERSSVDLGGRRILKKKTKI